MDIPKINLNAGQKFKLTGKGQKEELGKNGEGMKIELEKTNGGDTFELTTSGSDDKETPTFYFIGPKATVSLDYSKSQPVKKSSWLRDTWNTVKSWFS